MIVLAIIDSHFLIAMGDFELFIEQSVSAGYNSSNSTSANNIET